MQAANKIRVLAIDDNPADLLLVKLSLRGSPEMDFEVTGAGTLQEALALLPGAGFSVVLLDLNLPDNLGLEGIDKILATPSAPPVIVLTGSDNQETGLLALARNAQDYLVKGVYDADMLVRSIRYAIQRDRSEKAVRQMNSDLRLVMDSVPALIAYIDRDFHYQRVNASYQRWFGRPQNEIEGRHINELVGEAAWNLVKARMEQAMAGETIAYEEYMPYQAGAPRWVATTLVPNRAASGEVVGLVAQVTDISERKQAEQIQIRQNAILSEINNVLAAGLSCTSEQELGNACLQSAQVLTQSQFGFIGDVNENGLQDIAISNPGWEACQVIESGSVSSPGHNFKIHGIYGRVISDGQALFTNAPAVHPDRIGLPDGHPPLEAFLGVPLKHAGRTIGMLGMGNRPGGYTELEQQALEKLAPAIVEAFTHKRAQEALQSSQERYQAIVDTQSEFVARYLPGGVVTFANGAVCRFFACQPQDLLGNSFFRFIHADDRPEFVHRIEALDPNNPSFESEVRVILPDGRLTIQNWTHRALFDPAGAIIEYQCNGRDVTERKQMEKALKDGEESYRLLVQYAPTAIYELDFQPPRFRSVNEAMCQLSGYSREELLTINPLALLDVDSQKRFLERARQVMGGGQIPENIEYGVISKDGSKLTAVLNMRVINEDGKHVHALVVGHDITGRKQTEDMLRSANEELVKFNRAMVGREMKMIELKKEVDELCRQAGNPVRYYPIEDDKGKNSLTD